MASEHRTSEHRTSEKTSQLVRPLALLWLSGFALRATILALPPVLPQIGSELHLSASDIGLLAGLPPLLFALASIPGAMLIARFGAIETLVAGLVLNGLGAALRGFTTGALVLDLSTFLMCLGIAVMQPALPPLVRAWTPSRVGSATAVYTFGLLVGEVVPTVYVSHLALPLIGGGWRASLAIWALPVFVIAGLVAALGRRPRRAADAQSSGWWPDWRDGRIWRLGLLLGGVNAAYFGVNGFLPNWLTANDAKALVQPALVALNLAQIPASLLMLLATDRLLRRPAVYAGSGAVLLAGIVGAVAMPGPVAVICAGLFGVASAILLTLALALPAQLGEAKDVPRISAAVFTISYGFAMAMSLVGGQLSDRSGKPALAFLPFIVSALAVTLLGATLRTTLKPSVPRSKGPPLQEGDNHAR